MGRAATAGPQPTSHPPLVMIQQPRKPHLSTTWLCDARHSLTPSEPRECHPQPPESPHCVCLGWGRSGVPETSIAITKLSRGILHPATAKTTGLETPCDLPLAARVQEAAGVAPHVPVPSRGP